MRGGKCVKTEKAAEMEKAASGKGGKEMEAGGPRRCRVHETNAES